MTDRVRQQFGNYRLVALLSCLDTSSTFRGENRPARLMEVVLLASAWV